MLRRKHRSVQDAPEREGRNENIPSEENMPSPTRSVGGSKMKMMEKMALRKMTNQMKKNPSMMNEALKAKIKSSMAGNIKLFKNIQEQSVPLDDGNLGGGVAGAEMTTPTTSMDVVDLQELIAENDALFSRCRKLESQNIIATAQMVDLFAISLGIYASVIAYGIYITFMHYVSKKCCNWYYSDYFDIYSFAWQCIIITLPYLYNRLNYGITYRRFQVFAVAFTLIARIKMTRWRVNKYVTSKKKDDVDQDTGNDHESGPSRRQQSASQFGEDITEDDVWEGVYEVNARFLYSSILRLRGLWTKTAQYLSSRADFVPVAYVRELSKLMDEAPSTEWKDVEKMLQGAGIVDKFSYIEQEPIASASIGQVHMAKLKENYDDDNTERGDDKVVIKVQHPHAQTLLTDDFISLRIIARIVSILEPEYKFFEILMNEWANEAQKELDFRTEVENLQMAQESVRDMEESCSMITDAIPIKETARSTSDGSHGDHEEESFLRIPFAVEIPRPFPKLSSSRVMVMKFCEGKRIDDLDQIKRCNIPTEAAMNAVSQIFAHQMYASEIFNGDPHPGNIFIRPGIDTAAAMDTSKNSASARGFTIVVLDWGLAKRLPDSKRIGFCQMVYAAATFDFGLMMDGFKTLGLKLKREDVAEDMEGVRFLLRDMAPRGKARKRIKAKMKTDRKRFQGKKKGEKVPMESNAYPGEFFFFVRTNELLHGLGSRLSVDMKYLDVLRPFAEKGIKKSKTYMSLSNHPDPLLRESIDDQALQNKIDDTLNKLELSNDIIGAQVCVIDKDGRTLAHNVRGNMGSLKKHLPLRSDSLVLGFSVTKATAATLVHRMVQEGYMSYDEPICQRIWPDFCPVAEAPLELVQAVESLDGFENVPQRWKWKRSITLRHILTHSAGMWSAIPAKLSIKNLASCEKCVEAFEYKNDKPDETLLPTSAPGTECTYHYLSFGWLVGGCCTGAFHLRHGKRATYEEVYNTICDPLLSSDLKKAGFRPCGGGGSHDLAFTDADIDISRMMQMRKEAEAMGEKLETAALNVEQNDPASQRSKDLSNGMKGKEFILDPRIWNSADALNSNVPAAGGRFSAKGLAMFYYELSSGKILSSEILSNVTQVAFESDGLQLLQAQTDMTSDKEEEQRTSKFGLGYQIIQLPGENDASSFGHAGVGGSVGLNHIASQTSVGIMLNKASGGGDSAKTIIHTISKHLKW